MENKQEDLDTETSNVEVTQELKRDRSRNRARKVKPTRKVFVRRWLAILAVVALVAAGVFFGILFKFAPAALAQATYNEDNSVICEPFTGVGLDCNATWTLDEAKPRGELISQTPEAGQLLSVGSTVNLVYSNGPSESEFPDVAKLTLDEAKAAIYAVGGSIGAIEEVDGSGVEAGRVVEASIKAGDTIENGDEVTLKVASERANTPEWVGKTQAAIESEAKTLGIKVTFTEEASDETPGVALSQTPKAGEPLTGNGVALVVAKSQDNATVKIPDVVGKTAEEAQNELAQLGFRDITTVQVKNSQVTETQVTQVVPNVGEEAEKLDNIVIIVSEPN